MTRQTPVNLDLETQAMGPVTDLYQLTMMAGYDASGRSDDRAVFEVFVRKLPPRRSYLVFAGLEQAIDALIHLRFAEDQVNDLRTWPVFASVDSKWFDQLFNLRFEGDVWAVPEGSIVFEGEPLLRVEAALLQAQWVETLLLASRGYPTLVASKASRIIDAARGRGVIDFGARRGHGIQASLLSARAAYIAGFQGTSQVEAARRLGIPAMGTMAHSWVQAFDDEAVAFEAFSRLFPHSTLLVDTYDTREGVRLAAKVEPPIAAIRIDSGNLLDESRQARQILDEHQRNHVQIVASGDLEEDSIASLVSNQAPIDQFGVGTELITSGGAPAISMVYKLVECNGQGRIKQSSGKSTYPFAKQIDRSFAADGTMESDMVVPADEPIQGTPLMEMILRSGQLVKPLPSLEAIREHCREQRNRLPEELRNLNATRKYPVRYSDALQNEATRLSRGHRPDGHS